MYNQLSERFWKIYQNKRLFILCAALLVTFIFVVIFLVFSLKNNEKSDLLNPKVLGSSSGDLSPDTTSQPINDSSESKANSGSSEVHTNPTVATPNSQNMNTTTVLKTTTNKDGTTTKEFVSYMSVAYSAISQNDPNLKRGTTSVQSGQEGVKTIITSVVYGQNGIEVSRKIISEDITKPATNQITKIGISDFNLNIDTWDGTEFGSICSPADYTSGSDGCIGAPSEKYFSAVSISGIFYVYCISQATGTCAQNAIVNLPTVIAIHGDGTFNYQGVIFKADPRAGGGGSESLNTGHCSQFGLACGSW